METPVSREIPLSSKRGVFPTRSGSLMPLHFLRFFIASPGSQRIHVSKPGGFEKPSGSTGFHINPIDFIGIMAGKRFPVKRLTVGYPNTSRKSRIRPIPRHRIGIVFSVFVWYGHG
jgi:hypothetical protein